MRKKRKEEREWKWSNDLLVPLVLGIPGLYIILVDVLRGSVDAESFYVLGLSVCFFIYLRSRVTMISICEGAVSVGVLIIVCGITSYVTGWGKYFPVSREASKSIMVYGVVVIVVGIVFREYAIKKKMELLK